MSWIQKLIAVGSRGIKRKCSSVRLESTCPLLLRILIVLAHESGSSKTKMQQGCSLQGYYRADDNIVVAYFLTHFCGAQ